MAKKHKQHKSPQATKVVLGSLSGLIATSAVHPFDVLKVRMQLTPEHSGSKTCAKMFRREGLRSFYAGLSAGMMRQACYTTSRLGVYYWLYEQHKKWHGTTPSLSGKMRYGVYAGLVGAFAGCPADLVLVRMMGDGTLQSKRYDGLTDAFSKIYRDEGVCGLWRGAGLTLTRSMCFSVVQIGSYSQIREFLSDNRLAKGFGLHLYTSLISSLITAAVTLPVDLVKTRYQAINENVRQFDVMTSYYQERGLLGFWKGFSPYYTRLACHTVVTFYLFDVFSRTFNKIKEEKIST